MEERNRLAREIHDTLAQGLSAISLQLESADALLETGANALRVRSAVKQALALARDNLEEARRSVLDLRAAPLEGLTLTEALARLVQEHSARGGPEMRFEPVGHGRALPHGVEVGLYRIAQEALANALRHAQARRVTLHWATEARAVRLTVEDDGRGFDSSRVPRGRD